MMTEKRPVSNDEIHAFVDGRLAEGRDDEVAAWMRDNPDAAARAADYRRINAELARLFTPILDEPAPARLGAVARRHAARRWGRMAAAAALVALLIGTGSGWSLHAVLGGGVAEVRLAAGLAGEALGAHAVYTPEIRHPVEVAAAEQTHLVRWLSNRLGGPVVAPDLSAAGYSLIGGRLLASGGRPAGQFMYENTAGERLTLFVKHGDPDNRDTAFRYQPGDKSAVIWWIDGPFGYALSGPGDRARLEQIAHMVYERIKPE